MNSSKIDRDLISVCGMNCGLCMSYLAYSHDIPKKRGKVSHCSGCRARDKQCAFLKKRCEIIRDNKIEFCYQCDKFPCDSLKRLDKNYIKRYNYSFIDNLIFIKQNDIDTFISKEISKYKCSSCGDIKSVHNHKCYTCSRDELLQ